MITTDYYMIRDTNMAMDIATNGSKRHLVFAVTNDWWKTGFSMQNVHCASAYNVNPDSWAIVSNSAPAPYIFPKYTIYPNERTVFTIGEEGDEVNIALVSNLIQVARVERNRKKFVDMIDSIFLTTNAPPTPPLQRKLWAGAWLLKLTSLPE